MFLVQNTCTQKMARPAALVVALPVRVLKGLMAGFCAMTAILKHGALALSFSFGA